MFGLFKKDPTKKLNAQYKSLLEEAMLAQRNGDIEQYSKLTDEANAILREIEKIESSTDNNT
jgi:hypothetical protein